MFFPEKATTLATDIINELVQEVKVKPCPVVFASFSGAPKACMHQVLQIIEGICESKLNLKFAECLRELGADVKLVKWNGSPHVGHFKHYTIDYKAAVTELLGKAAVTELLGKAAGVYSLRIRQLEGESFFVLAGHAGVVEPISSLRKAAGASNGFRGVILASSDDYLPTSTEYYGVGSVQDEGLIHL